MPKVVIDNKEVQVAEGATLLQAAAQAGIAIPTLCQLDGCAPPTSCLVCVVAVNGQDRLLPACATAAQEGMVVHSQRPDVLAARRAAMELLLSDHVGDCIAPCQSACPAHMDIPRMLRALAGGDDAQAAEIAREAIPLAAVLGRICPAPCEKACRRGAIDQPLAICLLKRFAGDWALGHKEDAPPPTPRSSGKKVAVIGAGPAGLTGAWYLRLAGHAVTIFDRQDAPGGAMRQIPPDRLDPRVLLAEAGMILSHEIEFRPNAQVKRADLEGLAAQFDAVLVATGQAGGADGLLDPSAVDKSALRLAGANIFAAGAVLGAHRLAVRALAQGRQAARNIDLYLSGQAILPEPRPFTCRMGHLEEDELKELLAQAEPCAAEAPACGEGFSIEQARRQARRCLHCDCRKADDCRLRDRAAELEARPGRYSGQRRQLRVLRQSGGVIYEPGKCISCGLCVQITQQHAERLGLAFVGRGFSVRVAVPFEESLSAGLEKTARLCIQACPTGALAMDDTPAPPMQE